MMNKFIKSIMSATIGIGLMLGTTTPIHAATIDGTTEIQGTFESSTISVAIPATNSYSYNPNTKSTTMQPFIIKNNSNVAVSVSLKTIEVAATSTWKPTLVAPDSMTGTQWGNLTSTETKSKVSLGLLGYSSNPGWLNGIVQTHIWSTDLTSGPIKMGAIKANDQVGAEPLLKTGSSYDGQYSLTANYVFEFGLE